MQRLYSTLRDFVLRQRTRRTRESDGSGGRDPGALRLYLREDLHETEQLWIFSINAPEHALMVFVSWDQAWQHVVSVSRSYQISQPVEVYMRRCGQPKWDLVEIIAAKYA